MVLGLHHVAIRANNFDETIRFYTALLGLVYKKPGRCRHLISCRRQ
ncbi:VOC family protein [[Flexibacter] sp. ATCC 35208]